MVVQESESRLPRKRQGALLNIVDLAKIKVERSKLPNNEVTWVKIKDDLEDFFRQFASAQRTILPVYRKDIDSTMDVLHLQSDGRLIKIEKSQQSVHHSENH